MLHVEVENFQAIEKASLDFDGVTVIIGETNVGKSSLLRAIYGALRNIPGGTFIRDGQSLCTVQLSKVADGAGGVHDIQWVKDRKGSATYVVDGKEYSAIGRGSFKLLDDFGFGPVEAADRTIDPMFAKQGDPPFLLHDPRDAVAVISSAKVFSIVQLAMSLASSKRTSTVRERGVLEKQLAEVEEELEVLSSFDFDRMISILEQGQALLHEQAALLDELRGLHREVVENRGKVEFLSFVQRLDTEKVSRLVGFLELVQKCQEVQTEVRNLSEKLDRLGELTSRIQQVVDRVEFLDLVLDAVKAHDELTQVRRRLERVSSLLSSVKGLEVQAELLNAARTVRDVRRHVVAAKGLSDEVVKVRAQAEVLSSAYELVSIRRQLTRVQESLEETHGKVDALLKELGVCPVCGQKIA